MLLYDRKFRESVISSGDSLKGLLTIGPEAVDAQNQIKRKSEEISNKNQQITRSQLQISNPNGPDAGLKEKQAEIIERVSNRLWTSSRKSAPIHRTKLFPNITGKKQTFASSVFPKAFECFESGDPTETPSLDEIHDSYSKLQEAKGKHHPEVASEFGKLHSCISAINNLLETEIVNKGDSEYTKSISVLNANNWIDKGIKLLEKTKPNCPFCQRGLESGLIKDIQNAFSREYQDQLTELANHQQTLEFDIDNINVIDSIISNQLVVETTEISSKLQELRSKLNQISTNIKKKLEDPTLTFHRIDSSVEEAAFFDELKNLNDSIRAINTDLTNADEIESKLVTQALPSLIADCWEDIKHELEQYSKNRKAEVGLSKNIRKLEQQRAELENEVQELSKKVRSSKISLHEINKLIGFLVGDAFRLESATQDEAGNYRVVRTDGSPVGDSLSEGEQQLVAFLYFISTVWNIGKPGSDIEHSNAVVVIDDPMSSLDSDLLFGVASLLIDLIDGIDRKEYAIAQLICLTHNTTFYNNITFRFNQSDDKFQHFLIHKKEFGFNTTTPRATSPILSSYDSLWNSVRQAQTKAPSDVAGLANNMRRILENYFQAGWGLKQLPDLRDSNRHDQILVNSLVSWANAGSHNLLDSLEVSGPDVGVDSYLRVFKMIFEQTGQISHYNMMMSSTSSPTE